MDESLTWMLYHGIKLVKDLEQKLRTCPNLDSQTDLVMSCEEIIAVFNGCRDMLLSGQQMRAAAQELQHHHRLGTHHIQELLKSTAAAITGTATSVAGDGAGGSREYHGESHGKLKGLLQEGPQTSSLGQLGLMVGGEWGSGGGEIPRVAVDAPDPGKTSSRPRRRNNEGEKEVRLIPAPQVGNQDLPPDDGHTWRKYGQKEILLSKHPRSYYRCTHQKFYDCPAKKQVQRLDEDPYTFKVTYRGAHTCHMSSTAPSGGVRPPDSLPPTITAITAALTMHPASIPLNISSSLPAPTPPWLSMQNFGSGGPGSSASRMAPDFQMPVADMADAMFNSGSSSSNSMDQIFFAMDEKWDSEEKKD